MKSIVGASLGPVGASEVALVITLALAATACGGDDPSTASTTTHIDDSTTSSTSTAPERPTSTTTTEFDPASVEGQVEAAYLRSWDVYAEAVYDLVLDEEALAEVYAEDHLQTKLAEIERRVTDGGAALVDIEHDYTIQLVDDATAIVIDKYQNHQVLIDPETKAPTEPDPDELVTDVITLKLIAGSWKVSLKERLGE